MKTRVWWCFGAVLLVLLPLRAARANVSRSALRFQVDESVKKSSVGTAAYVVAGDQPWLVTVYHNIRGKKCTRSDCMTVSVGPDQTQLEVATLVDQGFCVYPRLGIAAAKLSPAGANLFQSKGGVAAALSADESPGKVTSLVAVGNPEIKVLGQVSKPFDYLGAGNAGQRARAQSFLPAAVTTEIARNTPLLLIEGFTITYGFSGGPVFESNHVDEKLLGIVQGGDPIQKNRSWAVPSDLIYEALQNDPCNLIPVPFAAQQEWPTDGFRDSLYSREDDVLAEVLESIPSSPITLEIGNKTEVTLALRWRDAKLASPVLIRPKLSGLPWLRRTGEINSPLPAAVVHAKFELMPTAAAPSHASLPLEFVNAETSEVMTTVEIPFETRYATRAVWDIGVAVEVTPDDLLFTLRGGYAPAWSISHDGFWQFATRLGVGPDILYAKRTVTNPVGRTLDESSAKIFGGIHGEVFAELRRVEHPTVGFRAGFGLVADYIFFNALAGTQETVRHYRIGPSAAVGFAIRPGSGGVLVLRVRGNYLPPVTLDSQYSGFSQVHAVATDYQPTGALELSYEFR